MLKKVILLLLVLGMAFAALMLTSRDATFSREDSLEMEHSAAAVWRVLVDVQGWPMWWPGVEKVSLEGKVREGNRIDLFLTGIPDGEPARVKTAAPLEELVWEREGILGSLTRTRLSLVAEQEGTVVVLESRISGPQAVLAKYARRDDFASYHAVVLRSLKLHLDRIAATGEGL